MGVELSFLHADGAAAPTLAELTGMLSAEGIPWGVSTYGDEIQIVIDPGATETGMLRCSLQAEAARVTFITFEIWSTADLGSVGTVQDVLAAAGFIEP